MSKCLFFYIFLLFDVVLNKVQKASAQGDSKATWRPLYSKVEKRIFNFYKKNKNTQTCMWKLKTCKYNVVLHHFVQAFMAIDTNGDGTLTLQEIRDVLIEQGVDSSQYLLNTNYLSHTSPAKMMYWCHHFPSSNNRGDVAVHHEDILLMFCDSRTRTSTESEVVTSVGAPACTKLAPRHTKWQSWYC